MRAAGFGAEVRVTARLGRLERAAEAEEGRVRFRVIVPPKMTRKEWQRFCRERTAAGAPLFTVRLDNPECEA